MTARSIIIISVLFFSCKNEAAKKQSADSLSAKKVVIPKEPEKPGINAPPDSTSFDYLIYQIKNERILNDHWTQKLKKLDIFLLPLDSMSGLSIIREWVINDSVSVIILSHANGTSYDEFLLTVMNRRDFVSKVQISDQADSDLSLENPYYYTEYKLLNDRTIRLFNHKITGIEGGEEKDRILSIDNWTIQDNGEILKK
jgi:hypothetical protein